MAFNKIGFTAGQVLKADHLNNLETNIETSINELEQLGGSLPTMFYTKEEIDVTLEDYLTQTQFNEQATQLVSELLITFYTKEQINEMLGTYVEEVASLVGGDA